MGNAISNLFASKGAEPNDVQPAPVPAAVITAAPVMAAAPVPVGNKPGQPGQCLKVANEYLEIGVDPQRGAGICWLSKKGGPNLLNGYDCGRFIQQSYYGKDDGSDWNGKKWMWNPVQCGSWQNRPARIMQCEATKPTQILTQVNPRNWAGQQLLDDVDMKADIQVSNKHAHVKFTMKYSGSENMPIKIQELPATFLTRKLGKLVFYDGPEPWKGKVLTVKTPGQVNENYRITENWAAFVDPATNQGVGVYTPVAQTMTCYRVGPDGSTANHDCSYFAPTMRFCVKPGVEMVYHTFFCVGTVDEIRKEFQDIKGWASQNRPEMLQCAAMQGALPAI